MLFPAPSQAFPQDNLTVLFPYSPRALIALKARLALAVDPFAPAPPTLTTLTVLAKQGVDLDSITSLNRLMSEVAADNRKYEDRVGRLTGGEATGTSTFAALVSFASWLSLGAQVSPTRTYLFRHPEVKEHMRALAQADEAMATEAEEGASAASGLRAGNWLTEAEEQSLALVTLWCSYPRILNSFLTAEEKTPDGSPKEVFPLFRRMQKALATVMALRLAVGTTGLRERAHFLRSALLKPLFEYMGKEAREDVDFYSGWVISLPSHPWLAEASAPGQPLTRSTAYGSHNPTMGMSTLRTGKGLWDTVAQWRSLRGASTAKDSADLRDLILDSSSDGFIKQFLRTARELKEVRDALDPTFLASAASTLELVSSPPSPPDVHLNGDTWRPLVMTGSQISEAVTSAWPLILRPRFPLTDADGDTKQLVGGATAYDYDARVWNEGGATRVYSHAVLTRPPHVPPLYVLPSIVNIAEAYSLGLLIPEQIKARVEGEYFGDTDAVTIPYTAAALATHLGYESPEAMRASPGMLQRIAHLFSYDDSKREWRPRLEASFLFHSSRTDQPWRQPVSVPVALVDRTLALDANTAPVEGSVQAVVMRTRDYPVAPQSSFTVADTLAAHALAGLGYVRGSSNR